MNGAKTLFIAASLLAVPAQAWAEDATGFRSYSGDRAANSQELPPYLQCVPYARQQSGVQIYGDAHSWWDQAAGRYERGHEPRIGAVMHFPPHRNMRLGHVAAVSRILDSRRVLLRHANWSPINGRRGQIENDVLAVDVSPGNDWSSVRVWYDPIQDLGRTAWPVSGFIYADGAAPADNTKLASAPTAEPVRRETSPEFRNAFADIATEAPISKRARFARADRVKSPAKQHREARRQAARPVKGDAAPTDRIAAAIARYE
ncbi:CHAP domain-containing protein [Altererythrobacter sp. SALINAS58]|uniref:CHAP domain-containing protein n=1 Tax=Alteripontixanthobacter muriae TaxID=2705546 RepID=UPI001576AF92|nr:CHAP domain-containing protein [Alteripontixanthobacter muriae]NTZ42307.1 CHAP domain-containing protein [Alteripontixanthobacter muriae]